MALRRETAKGILGFDLISAFGYQSDPIRQDTAITITIVDDAVGIGFGIAKIGGNAVEFDQDTVFYSGSPYPVRSSESFIEVTYQYVVAPWMQIQPDFQYFFLPSGGVPNPNSPGNRIGNEAVFDMRTNIVF